MTPAWVLRPSLTWCALHGAADGVATTWCGAAVRCDGDPATTAGAPPHDERCDDCVRALIERRRVELGCDELAAADVRPAARPFVMFDDGGDA